MLVAALDPPLGRTLMLAGLIETVTAAGVAVELGTVRWRGGSLAPAGYAHLEEFRLEGSVPVWRYATPAFVLEKRVWMDDGANVTRIEWRNLWSEEPLALSVKVLTDHRDYHGRTVAGEVPAIAAEGDTLRWRASTRCNVTSR